ncbi:hypothetical protein ACOMHN_022891 [Nucella lapillus]
MFSANPSTTQIPVRPTPLSVSVPDPGQADPSLCQYQIPVRPTPSVSVPDPGQADLSLCQYQIPVRPTPSVSVPDPGQADPSLCQYVRAVRQLAPTVLDSSPSPIACKITDPNTAVRQVSDP